MEKQITDILFDPTIGRIVTIIVGVAIIWLVVKAIQRNLFSKIKDSENRYRAKKFGSFMGYLMTVILLVIVFSDKLGGLTVALGVAGAGIAFALQEVIASFAGWLAIIFGRFYKTGDRVQLGGIKGDVKDIGVLRTNRIPLVADDNWVEFTLRYVVNYKRRRTTKTELFTQVLKKIDATNGQVRFASATFQLVDPPEFKVKLEQ